MQTHTSCCWDNDMGSAFAMGNPRKLVPELLGKSYLPRCTGRPPSFLCPMEPPRRRASRVQAGDARSVPWTEEGGAQREGSALLKWLRRLRSDPETPAPGRNVKTEEKLELQPQPLGSQQGLPRPGASHTRPPEDTRGMKPLHPLTVLGKAQCHTPVPPA